MTVLTPEPAILATCDCGGNVLNEPRPRCDSCGRKGVSLMAGPQSEFVNSDAPYPGYFAGRRCVAPETLIEGEAIADRKAGLVTTLLGPAQATAGFLKGRADLYRVVTESGRAVSVTLDHRFLTPDGWRPLRDLHVGALLATDGTEHGRSVKGTRQGSPADCYASPRQHGGSPCQGERAGRDRWPQPRRTGDGSSAYPYPLPGDVTSRPSMTGAFPASPYRRAESRPTASGASVQLLSRPDTSRQSHGNSHRPDSVPLPAPSGVGTWAVDRYGQFPDGRPAGFVTPLIVPSQALALPLSPSPTAGMPLLPHPGHVCVGTNCVATLPYADYITGWDEIASISFDRYGEYYDISVPGADHYSAHGLWHHNSGKTVAGLVKLFAYANKHPGCNLIVTQPTHGDFQTTFLITLREFFGDYQGKEWIHLEKKGQIFFPSINVTVFLRPALEFDGLRGGTYAAGWMDEIGREDQHQAFLILQPACTAPGYPNQIWVTSTPVVERPWIKKRWVDGVNPLTGDPLNAADYPIFKARTVENYHLDQAVRDRLISEWGHTRWAKQELEGDFLAVEGAGFPELDETIHLRRPPLGHEFVRYVAGIDFGAVQPTAVIIIGIDRSNRAWALKEFYKRNATDHDWLTFCADNNVKDLYCDPSASERDLDHWRRTYGIPIRRSHARRFDERIRIVVSRLAVGPDGLPGLYITPDCPNLWDELRNLQFHKARGHEYAADAWTPGAVDHAYDSCAYGLSALDYGPRGRPVSPITLQFRS